MMKHIKGPWHVDPHSLWICAPSEKGGDCYIADIRGWGYLTGKGSGALGLHEDEAIAIQKANARLIAAAPDLLAALQHVMEDDGLIPRATSACRAVVAAAIARATGAQP